MSLANSEVTARWETVWRSPALFTDEEMNDIQESANADNDLLHEVLATLTHSFKEWVEVVDRGSVSHESLPRLVADINGVVSRYETRLKLLKIAGERFAFCVSVVRDDRQGSM